MTSTRIACLLVACMMVVQLSMGQSRRPLIIAEQGSFSIGGRDLTVPGTFDPTRPITSDAGEIFHVDQMYVHFQIPPNARKYPVILVHGNAQSGRAWESTPDGREGFASIFLRNGFSVYVVDLPRRGRAGFPSFKGPLGSLQGQQVMADRTTRFGAREAWSRFRLGPSYLTYYSGSQFPAAAFDQFMQMHLPTFPDDENAVADDLAQLLERIGPALLVAHSLGARYAYLAGVRSDNIAGLVDLEGVNQPFPAAEAPQPIPLYDNSTLSPGGTLEAADFAKLSSFPIRLFQGDYYPVDPQPDLLLDQNRVRAIYREQFVATLNRHGGNASFVRLPDIGIYGNTHHLILELNNDVIAQSVLAFFRDNVLHSRGPMEGNRSIYRDK